MWLAERPARRRLALRILAPLALSAAVAAAAGCEKPQAYGRPNSLIVVLEDSVWSQVEDTTYAALERTVRTTRWEKQFRVTHVTPGSESWPDVRPFYQVIVGGPPGSSLVQEILEAAGREAPSPPAVVRAQDVWARGQVATGVVLDPGAPADSWTSQLDRVYRTIDQGYREFVEARMFASGRDSALADTLRRRLGFRLMVPRVYQWAYHPRDSVAVFRNDNPSPSDLIRSVAVGWTRDGPDSLTAEDVADWRRSVDSLYYGTPQSFRLDTVVPPRRVTQGGWPALEARGAWEDEDPYPAGGPFVARAVRCPDRTYFLDAWLYAPGKDAYPYVLQLRNILRSFDCTPGRADAAGGAAAGGAPPGSD